MENDKIRQCIEALERLITGDTINVAADSYSEITFGLIEREAGTVSKGYIKHARPAFAELVEKLNRHKQQSLNRSEKESARSILQRQVDLLQKAKERDELTIKRLEQQLDILMADNIKLFNRARELEIELFNKSPAKKMDYQTKHTH